MKVTIKIDATPQEMRTLMGLPDIEHLQKEIVEKLREKAFAQLEMKEPAEFMKFLMPTAENFKSIEAMQTSFWQAFGKDLNVGGDNKDKK